MIQHDCQTPFIHTEMHAVGPGSVFQEWYKPFQPPSPFMRIAHYGRQWWQVIGAHCSDHGGLPVRFLVWLGIPKLMIPYPLLGQGAVRIVGSHVGRIPNCSEVPQPPPPPPARHAKAPKIAPPKTPPPRPPPPGGASGQQLVGGGGGGSWCPEPRSRPPPPHPLGTSLVQAPGIIP